MATPQIVQSPVLDPSIVYSPVALDILMKLNAFGVREYTLNIEFPSDQPYALVYPGYERNYSLLAYKHLAQNECRDIRLRVRHGAGEVRVWLIAPAKDTLIGVGIIGHLDDFIPHPFFLQPIPWSIEHLLQPLWDRLGITYRSATVADVFGDPSQLV